MTDLRTDIALQPETPDLARSPAQGQPWTAGLLTLLPLCAAGYAGIALLADPQMFAGLLPVYLSKLGVVLALCLVLVQVARAILQRSPEPTAFIIGRTRDIAPRLTATIALIVLVTTAFTTLKSNIPALVPFYADPWIARADAWLHGGEPWRVVHRLPEIAGLVIDTTYSRIWFGLVLGTVIVATVIEPSPRFRRLVGAFLAVLILNGTLLALALSSVGPIFYREFFPDPYFVGLTETIAGNAYISAVPAYAQYLLDSYRNGAAQLGSGISAMPSVHVSLAVLTAWYMSSFGPFRAAIGWLQAAVIMIGSVYTGWHYALDGYLALFTTSLVWLALSRLYRLPLGWRRPQAGRDMVSANLSGLD